MTALQTLCLLLLSFTRCNWSRFLCGFTFVNRVGALNCVVLVLPYFANPGKSGKNQLRKEEQQSVATLNFETNSKKKQQAEDICLGQNTN